MPANTNQKTRPRHWSKNVRDVSIAHDSLHIRIEGGAENAEFLFVGGFTSDQIKYRKGRLRSGDILIELNDEAVVGLTLQDLMNRINKAGKKVNFKVVQPGGGISKDMRDYLRQDFPSSNEVDLDLQDIIRDNLYARTVPCTSRPPRLREEPGIDYIFVSKEKFKEMENNGDFVETGTYNGHYYGTLKPTLKVDSVEEPTANDENKTMSTDNKKINDTEANELVTNNNVNITVHREGENNITGGYVEEVENNKSKTVEDDSLENHFVEV